MNFYVRTSASHKPGSSPEDETIKPSASALGRRRERSCACTSTSPAQPASVKSNSIPERKFVEVVERTTGNKFSCRRVTELSVSAHRKPQMWFATSRTRQHITPKRVSKKNLWIATNSARSPSAEALG